MRRERTSLGEEEAERGKGPVRGQGERMDGGRVACDAQVVKAIYLQGTGSTSNNASRGCHWLKRYLWKAVFASCLRDGHDVV